MVPNFDYIEKINPYILVLIKIIKSLGCNVVFQDDIGGYGVLLFQYENETLGIWLDDTHTINIFYPNWSIIPRSSLSKEAINTIQSYIRSHQACVYWLCNDDSFTLSSNICIDVNLINERATRYIKECICNLIESKNIFPKTENNEILSQTSSESINAIKSSLYSCGCKNIEEDDEGDIHFKWDDKSMYLHLDDNFNCKIFYNLGIMRDVSDKIDESPIDIIALSIQWSNMIWPIKCTFYHPDEQQTSITATVTIDLSYFINSHIELICRRLNELASFFNDCLSDLLFGSEDGCDIINTWYQPDIYNCKVKH